MSNQIISELKEKVEKYEGILEEVLQEKSARVCKIQSGPSVENNKNWYRVQDGQSTLLANFQGDIFFNSNAKQLNENTEVVIIGNQIVGVIPEILSKKVEIPEMDLITWDEIGGLKSQLREIRATIEIPLLNPDLMKAFGYEPMKGLLLYGPPGCGKTLIAKAVASTILNDNKANHQSFKYIKGAEMLSRYVGDTERSIVSMFKESREYTRKTGKRGVIFIDEAEAILPARGSRVSSDVDKTIVPTFLSEMSGFDKHSPFVILSTNLPKSIDPAILREGRIDVKVKIGHPTMDDAKDIFNIHLKKVKKLAEPQHVLAEIGATTLYEIPNACNIVTGAMIETVVKRSTRSALQRAIDSKGNKNTLGIISQDILDSIKTLTTN